MGAFEHFPYANFHDLNLDWILGVVKGIPGDVKAAQDEMRPTFQEVTLLPEKWVKAELNGYYYDVDLGQYNVPANATLNVGMAGDVFEPIYNAIANAKITVGSYVNTTLRLWAYGDVPKINIYIGVIWWR